MMPSEIKAAITISEVMRTNANVVDHFHLYQNHCQDKQLRAILDRQQQHNLDSTQKMMHMIQNHGLDSAAMPQPQSMATAPPMTGATSAMPPAAHWSTMPGGQQQHMPGNYQTTGTAAPTGLGHQQNPGVSAINDRVIADGMLAFLKCQAETCTRAALESAEPHLRQAMTNMARNSIEMSYEVCNYMHKQGWHQQPADTGNYISHAPTQYHQHQHTQHQQFHPQ